MQFDERFVVVDHGVTLCVFCRSSQYTARGVRWVYHGEGTSFNTTFSQDLEPEYLTLNADESVAYVVLQVGKYNDSLG